MFLPYPTQLDYLMSVKRKRKRSLSRLGQLNAIFRFSSGYSYDVVRRLLKTSKVLGESSMNFLLLYF